MTFSHRLTALRFALEALYRREAASRSKPAPPLHALLAVPIAERLVLLALLDGATAPEVKQLLKVSDQDAALSSDRMTAALATLQAALADPFSHLVDEIDPDNLHPAEVQLRQLLFPSAAACLVGESVPPQMAQFPLRDRLIAYCLVVEELRWEDVERLLGCSEWAIRCALKEATRLTQPLPRFVRPAPAHLQQILVTVTNRNRRALQQLGGP